MSAKLSFTTVTEDGAYPSILMAIKDEANNREFELEINLSSNGVTIKLPNQTSEVDNEKSIVVDVWEGQLSAYIFDNSIGEDPQKISIIPKLNHTLETSRIVAHDILKNTPYGKIIQNSTENEERMTRAQLISAVKTLKDRVRELESADILLKELQEE